MLHVRSCEHAIACYSFIILCQHLWLRAIVWESYPRTSSIGMKNWMITKKLSNSVLKGPKARFKEDNVTYCNYELSGLKMTQTFANRNWCSWHTHTMLRSQRCQKVLSFQVSLRKSQDQTYQLETVPVRPGCSVSLAGTKGNLGKDFQQNLSDVHVMQKNAKQCLYNPVYTKQIKATGSKPSSFVQALSACLPGHLHLCKSFCTLRNPTT